MQSGKEMEIVTKICTLQHVGWLKHPLPEVTEKGTYVTLHRRKQTKTKPTTRKFETRLQNTILEMIDCHSHLADKDFDDDRETVLERAWKADVTFIIVATTSVEDAQKVLDVCAMSSKLRPALGVHPEFCLSDIDALESLGRGKHEDIVAIGEVGLDFTPRVLKEQLERGKEVYGFQNTEDVKKHQRGVFQRMIKLALDLNLPLIVHSRSAGHYAIEMLEQAGVKDAVLHAFDGKAHHIERAATENGMFTTVPPNSIRIDSFKKMIKRVPIEKLVLETDSPSLAPTPGDRNEPANLRYSVEVIADIKGITVEEVVAKTTENAKRLFPKLVKP